MTIHGCKRAGGFMDSNCTAACDCHKMLLQPRIAIPADYFDKYPSEAPRQTLTESALWSHLLQVPNRLFGATITPEGDADLTPEQRAALDIFGRSNYAPNRPDHKFPLNGERISYNELVARYRIGAPQIPASRVGDWMQTASGRQFWPLDPRPEEIHIEDIAAALSKLCRYGGHCKRFYSVAEHCVLAASMAMTYPLETLMHDASEAYLSDVIRPIKAHLTNYRTVEAYLERVIAERFCLQYPLPTDAKHLDERILADEKDQAMLPAPAAWTQWTEVPPLGVTLQFWSPDRAESEFLDAFSKYGGISR